MACIWLCFYIIWHRGICITTGISTHKIEGYMMLKFARPLAQSVSDPLLNLCYTVLLLTRPRTRLYDPRPTKSPYKIDPPIPWWPAAAFWTAIRRPRLDFFRFFDDPERHQKTTIFRHRPKSIKSMNKSTLTAPRVDFG